MADNAPTEPTEGTGATQEANQVPSAEITHTHSDDEPFDKDRALATIRKLREFEKTAKSSLKELSDLKAKATQDETERLKQAGEYKALHEKAQARIAELEPTVAERDRYKGVVESLLQVERKGLPKHITALLDKLDPADQLAWIAENRETVAKPGVPNLNPRDGQGPPGPKDEAEAIANARRIFGI